MASFVYLMLVCVIVSTESVQSVSSVQVLHVCVYMFRYSYFRFLSVLTGYPYL